MTHPAAGCTRAQREAFERIAVNEPPRCSPKTLNTLLGKKLVTKHTNMTNYCSGDVLVQTSYSVPIKLHHQWGQWCSEQFKGIT